MWAIFVDLQTSTFLTHTDFAANITATMHRVYAYKTRIARLWFWMQTNARIARSFNVGRHPPKVMFIRCSSVWRCFPAGCRRRARHWRQKQTQNGRFWAAFVWPMCTSFYMWKSAANIPYVDILHNEYCITTGKTGAGTSIMSRFIVCTKKRRRQRWRVDDNNTAGARMRLRSEGSGAFVQSCAQCEMCIGVSINGYPTSRACRTSS